MAGRIRRHRPNFSSEYVYDDDEESWGAWEGDDTEWGRSAEQGVKVEASLARVAATVGLPPGTLSVAEEAVFADVLMDAYTEDVFAKKRRLVELRNLCLQLWAADPKFRSYITQAACEAQVGEEEQPLMRRMHSFLERHSHINFGSTLDGEDPLSLAARSLSKVTGKSQVVVVGAGASGLAAAKQLARMGNTVTVLEARGRIGGRVFSDTTTFSTPVDLGASIVTGCEANVEREQRPDPSDIVLRQVAGEYRHVINASCPLYDGESGQKISEEADDRISHIYNELLDLATEKVQYEGEGALHSVSLGETVEEILRKRGNKVFEVRGNKIVQSNREDMLSAADHRMLNWHFAHLEYGCSAQLRQVSIAHCFQDELYDKAFSGPHCFVKGGYSQAMSGLAQGLDIRLNAVVKEIDTSGEGVRITTSDGGVYEGDIALVTLPLGVLKARSVTFTPELPVWKESAIGRLGMGSLNKIALEFPHKFWDNTSKGAENDFFGVCHEEDAEKRGQCFMFWDLELANGVPILVGILAGSTAREVEGMENDRVEEMAMAVLRKRFGSEIPSPIASTVTRWSQDPYSRGSYSYVAVGASGQDYDDLGHPVDTKLFFAGEHTWKENPDTVGGAMLSGMREAVRIHLSLKGLPYDSEFKKVQRDDALETKVRGSLDAARLSDEEEARRKMFALVSAAETNGERLFLVQELMNFPAPLLKHMLHLKSLQTFADWMRKGQKDLVLALLRLMPRIPFSSMEELKTTRLPRTVINTHRMYKRGAIGDAAVRVLIRWKRIREANPKLQTVMSEKQIVMAAEARKMADDATAAGDRARAAFEAAQAAKERVTQAMEQKKAAATEFVPTVMDFEGFAKTNKEKRKRQDYEEKKRKKEQSLHNGEKTTECDLEKVVREYVLGVLASEIKDESFTADERAALAEKVSGKVVQGSTALQGNTQVSGEAFLTEKRKSKVKSITLAYLKKRSRS